MVVPLIPKTESNEQYLAYIAAQQVINALYGVGMPTSDTLGLNDTLTIVHNGKLTTVRVDLITGGGSGTIDLGAPGPIGNAVPNTGAFTLLTANSLDGAAIGAVSPSTGAFTDLSSSGTVSGPGFTARFSSPGPIGDVTPSSGAFTSLTASGSISGAGVTAMFASPPPIGDVVPNTGAFTTLTATTVSGSGFSTYLASPPAIGGTAPAAGSFTNLSASTSATFSPSGTVTVNPTTTGAVDNMVIGAHTPEAGSFTTLTASSTVSGAGFTAFLSSPSAIGNTAPSSGQFTDLNVTNSATLSPSGAVTIHPVTTGSLDNIVVGGGTPAGGSFTTLSASGVVSGAGFTARFSSPGPIGNTAASSGAFTTLNATSISAGSMDSTPIGSVSPSTGTFTVGSFGSLTASGTVDLSGASEVKVPAPVNPSDAVTKSYADAAIAGLQLKQTATVATTTGLPTYTYVSGVITITATGTLTIDGHVTALNDVILVKNETSSNAPYNGLYTVTTAGATGISAVLTRANDMSTSTEFTGAIVVVSNAGTANANTVWICNPTGTVTVGTTNIPFTQINAIPELVGATGITISGTTASLSAIPSLDILANITGGSAAPIPNTLSGIVDAVLGINQGGVLVRGATALQELAPGVSGFALVSQGTSTVPAWQAQNWSAGNVTTLGTQFVNTSGTLAIKRGVTLDSNVLNPVTINDLTVPNTMTLTTSDAIFIPTADMQILPAGDVLIEPSGNATIISTGSMVITATTGGSLDGLDIGGVSPHPGTFTDFTVVPQAGTVGVNLSPDGSFVINPGVVGTMDNVDVGNSIPGNGSFTNLTVSSLNSFPFNADQFVLTSGSLTIKTGPTISVIANTNPMILNANTAIPAAFSSSDEFRIIGVDGAVAGMSMNAFGNNGYIAGARANGTEAAPTVVGNGDGLFQFQAWGWNGTGYSQGARISFTGAETFSGTANGTFIRFITANTGTTSLTTKLQVGNRVVIGSTTEVGTNNLQVTGGASFDSININSTGSLSAFKAGQLAINSGTLSIVTGPTIMVVDSTGTSVAPMIVQGNTAVPPLHNHTLIEVIGSNTGNPIIMIDAFAGIPQIQFRRRDGTVALPTAVQSGDNLGQFGFSGAIDSTGSNFNNGAGFSVFATENYTSTTAGSQIKFNVIQTGNTNIVVPLTIQATAGTADVIVSGGLASDYININATGSLSAFDITNFFTINSGTLAVKNGPTISTPANSPAILQGNSVAAPGGYSSSRLLGLNGSPASNAIQVIDAYGGVGGLALRRQNGTAALPTALVTGDVNGVIEAGGYNGTAWPFSSTWQTFAIENWSSTANGSSMTFSITKTGQSANTGVVLITGASGQATMILKGSGVTATDAPVGSNVLQVTGGASFDSININTTGSLSALNSGQLAINSGTLSIITGPTITINDAAGTVQPLWVNANTGVPSNLNNHTAIDVVGSNGANPIIMIDAYAGIPQYRVRRWNGSLGTPTAINNGDVLGQFQFAGYTGTGTLLSTSTGFNAAAIENFTTLAQGSAMNFGIIVQGTTNQATRFIITGATGVAAVQASGGFSSDTISNTTAAGSTLNAASIGATTAGTGAFTTLSANAAINFSGTISAFPTLTNGSLSINSGKLINTDQDIQVFTNSGTWTKPAWATANSVTEVYMLGGGGSGGGGGQGTASMSGGAAGAGGAAYLNMFNTSSLSATEIITVGTGGVGGLGAPGSAAATSCTIQASSAIILGTNSFYSGQAVQFASITTGGSSFSTGTVYFVSATGLSGTQFELSATRGGAVITNNTTGSAATVYPIDGYNGNAGSVSSFGSHGTAYAGGGGGGGNALGSGGGAAAGIAASGASGVGNTVGGAFGGAGVVAGSTGTASYVVPSPGNVAGSGSPITGPGNGQVGINTGGAGPGGSINSGGTATTGGNGGAVAGVAIAGAGSTGGGNGSKAVGNGALFPLSGAASGGGANSAGVGGTGGGPTTTAGSASYGAPGGGGGAGSTIGGPGGNGSQGIVVVVTRGT